MKELRSYQAEIQTIKHHEPRLGKTPLFTGAWLLAEIKLESWRSGHSDKMAWIRAPAGLGIGILAETILTNLEYTLLE